MKQLDQARKLPSRTLPGLSKCRRLIYLLDSDFRRAEPLLGGGSCFVYSAELVHPDLASGLNNWHYYATNLPSIGAEMLYRRALRSPKGRLARPARPSPSHCTTSGASKQT